MISDEEFIANYLKHAYDPVKAREYYLKVRKLKGRKPGSPEPVNPRSKVMYNGKPLKKPGSRMEEDETPEVSPSGAKLVDYDGKGLGKGTYADGSIYDGASGWKSSGKAVAAPKAASPVAKQRRIGAAEQKLIRAKTLANKVKDPVVKRKLLQQLNATEKKLKAVQGASSIKTTRPVLRKQGPG